MFQKKNEKIAPCRCIFIRRSNKHIKFAAVSLILLLLISLPSIIASAFLPETIHLIKGKAQVFDLNVPVSVVYKSNDISAFRINEEEVTTETNGVMLNNSFSVMSDEAGDAEVTVSVFGVLPVKKITVSTIPDIEVIPCGSAVGVRINTDGIMVLGTGIVEDGNEIELEPAKNLLKAGDLILSANGKVIENKQQLTKIIEESDGEEIAFNINRNNETLEIKIAPVLSKDDNCYKMGIWVRDSTQGIGTITYYNPETMNFGALGHGIMDIDTKKLMTVKDGAIMKSGITSAKKGKKGAPGELLGTIENDNIIGKVTLNNKFGIYGTIYEEQKDDLPTQVMKIGLQTEVVEGEAYILSTIDGDEPKKFSVMIESINKYSNDESKGMIVRITDNALLKKTNGIVQGMSGSPIIQNNKLVGAVTHVFVQDPSKGYGIFIENMIKQENNKKL